MIRPGPATRRSLARMASTPVTTDVHRTRTRPVRFLRYSALDGTTLVTGGVVPMSSSNNGIATVEIDPSNSRRALIHGNAEGTATITIGSAPSPLTVNVTVGPQPDLSHWDLDGIDDEI